MYKEGQEGKLFNMKEFTITFVKGLLTSVFIFFVTYLTVNDMESNQGIIIDYNVFQATLQTQVVLAMSAKMCFCTRSWTLISFAGKLIYMVRTT